LLHAIEKRIDMPMDDAFDGLLEDVRRFSGKTDFEDDVCLVGMEVCKLG
jgi:serine phosphatase RsbU (regulator of sigma subunit)